MKIKIVLALFVFGIFSTSAQVGINNTDPHPSAALDISSTNKGILIPRMTSSQRNAIQNPAPGLMVFQTNANPGFYYFDSTWKTFGDSSPNTGWALDGNSGTNPVTDFVGTTDAKNLILKTDGKERMRINSSGQLEVNRSQYSSLDVKRVFSVYGISDIDNGTAIYGYSYGNLGHGLWGVNENGGRGVTGNSNGNTGVGVFGSNSDGAGSGVLGINFSGGNGVEGTTMGSGYAIFANGASGATGVKSFVIDDPRDPANKILKHFSIESNEVLNIYRGMETFDESGSAIVKLPEYYNIINKKASYQLTPVGAPMPNLYISREISDGTFGIAGGIAGKKVSWILTAERNDPYLQQNPEKRQVEVDKGKRRGLYLMPQLYGQPMEKAFSPHYLEQRKNQEEVQPKTQKKEK